MEILRDDVVDKYRPRGDGLVPPYEEVVNIVGVADVIAANTDRVETAACSILVRRKASQNKHCDECQGPEAQR